MKRYEPGDYVYARQANAHSEIYYTAELVVDVIWDEGEWMYKLNGKNQPVSSNVLLNRVQAKKLIHVCDNIYVMKEAAS